MKERARPPTHTAGAWLEISFMIVSLLLAGVSIWLSTWDPIWTAIGLTDVELRASLGAALSIVLLLAGFLPAIYLQNNRLRQKINTEGERVVEELVARLSHLPALELLTNRDAYDYLVVNLPNAQSAWNTRLSGHGITPKYDSRSGKQYREYIEKAIAGGLEFTEIVTEAWSEDARALEESVAKSNTTNYYSYSVLNSDIPPILNFIIIRYRDDRREVMSGWVNSRNRNWEQPCLLFRDPRIVEYFTQWYMELEREAERTSASSAVGVSSGHQEPVIKGSLTSEVS